MSIVNVKEQDELVQCPYDAAHRVRAIRFTRHLIKCQRNSSTNLAPCPFNHQHRIPVHERANHMTTCPDRIVVERDVFRDQDCTGDLALPPSFPTIPIPSDEDWDAACSPGVGPAYNPLLQMKKAQFHNPSILSSMKPVDKRAYRKELQTKKFGDEIDESFDESVDLVPILGLKKLIFPDEDVKGFYPRPAPRKSISDQQHMSSNMSDISGVTPRRGIAPVSSSSMGYDSASRNFTSGPGSFAGDSQSWTSGARTYNSSGPRSVISDHSSLNGHSIISDANSSQSRSSFSAQSSGSSAIFSLRGRGRGLRFEKHLPEISKY